VCVCVSEMIAVHVRVWMLLRYGCHQLITTTTTRIVYGSSGFCPGLPGWAGTKLDLLKQEIVSGSGISWAICNASI